ncbi:protein FAM98B [Atheta coriaria]|uniref:protein FAM98B n=1 Tax=Dalotia coriaria TaxID=877792 RepID=UPI0031F3D786
MDESILSLLKTTGYEISEDEFSKALNQAPKSIEYSKMVHYITTELKGLNPLDEQVNVIAVPEDSVSFILEVGSFLKEIGCPYQTLSQGSMEDRLNSMDNKLLLLHYLLSKLLAARMQQHNKPDKKIKLKVQESPEANNLQKILTTLDFPKEIANLPCKELLDKVNLKLETIVTECGKDLLGNPIWNYQLNDQQWDQVANVQNTLNSEYTIRRKMMLQRLDCTIQSFQWSDKMKHKGDLIMQTYTDNRKELKVEPDVDISSLLAARDDLAIIEKTSNSSVRKNTKSRVNTVIIDKVPDRGGRPSEQAAPAPEMPSWQARQAGGGRGGRGGGGRGGDGGYNRGGRGGGGGYNQNHGQNQQKQQQQSFDAAGPYTTSHHHPSGGNNYNNQQRNNYGQQAAGYQRHDDPYQESKRPRTYDSFQNQRQTYADQYVQESQYNQQHQPRHNRGGGGRGRSNYYRGGRGRGGGGGGGHGQNYY